MFGWFAEDERCEQRADPDIIEISTREESLEVNNTKIENISHAQYVESETWKCNKSPTVAHHWIINGNMMKCKYCHEEKYKTQQPEPRSRI